MNAASLVAYGFVWDIILVFIHCSPHLTGWLLCHIAHEVFDV